MAFVRSLCGAVMFVSVALLASAALMGSLRGQPALAASHIRVIGTLTRVDLSSRGTGLLTIYSKTHGSRYVDLTPQTIVKRGTLTQPRAALQTGQYVYATCIQASDGRFEAVTIHIEKHAPTRHVKKTA